MKYLRENSSKRHYPNRYIGINKTRNRGRKGSYTALTNYMEVQRVYESYCTKNRKQPPELGLNESVWEKTKRSFPNRQKDIQKNYNLKIPCSYIGLRGGASSPDDDDSRNHRVRGNDNGSDQSSDGNDSLYRVDIQGGLSDEPADTSYEHTNGNAPDTENLENHMAQAGSLVNGSDEPHYNGAPATQGHMEDGASYGEFNGDFVASEDVGGHVLRNGMSDHVSNGLYYDGAPVTPRHHMDSHASNEYTNKHCFSNYTPELSCASERYNPQWRERPFL